MTERHNDSRIIRSDRLPQMAPKEKPSSRRSIRVDVKNLSIQIKYKFFSHVEDLQCSTIFTGTVLDLSKGGAQIKGSIPHPTWLIPLGSGSVYIGCNILLDADTSVKTLTRARWIRSTPAEYQLGLEFVQMSDDQRDSLNHWLVRQQIKSFRIRRRDEILRDR